MTEIKIDRFILIKIMAKMVQCCYISNDNMICIAYFNDNDLYGFV